MKRPKWKNTNGSGYETRQADYELWAAYGVRRYQDAKQCPECGHGSTRRRPEGKCMACCVADGPEAQRECELDVGHDVLAMTPETLAAIQAAGLKPRADKRAADVLPREYAISRAFGVREVAHA
jgi:hypothetical protein